LSAQHGSRETDMVISEFARGRGRPAFLTLNGSRGAARHFPSASLPAVVTLAETESVLVKSNQLVF